MARPLGGLLAAALLAAFPVFAQASAPPRSVADVLAALEEHKPDPTRIETLKTIVARQPPPGTEPVDLRKFHLQRGRAAAALGMIELQIEDLRKVFALTPRGDASYLAYGLELAVAELLGGDFVGAMKRFESFPGLAPHDGARVGAWTMVTSIRAQTGNLPGAREALKQAEHFLAAVTANPRSAMFYDLFQALVIRARAQIKRYEGRYAEAEADNWAVLRLWERVIEQVPMHSQVIDITVEDRVRSMLLWELHHQVPILLEQGKFADAEVLARRALNRSLARFARYSPESAWTLGALAHTVLQQGRFQEAEALARAAEDIHLKIGTAPYSKVLGDARRVIGESSAEQGKHADALRILLERREGLRKSPSGTDGLQLVSPALVHALVRTGKTAEAVADARAYYADLHKRFGRELYLALEAHGLYAAALAADKQREQALREFREAIPALLAAASERTGEEGLGILRTRELTRILEAYIALLGEVAAAGVIVDGLDPVAEAFRIADIARGSSVQRALSAASARAAIHDPALAKLAREEQDAGNRIGSLSEVLVDLLSRPADKRPDAVISGIRQDIAGLRKRRAELRAEIAAKFPDYAQLTDPKPVTLSQVQQRLAPGEAMVALYGAEDRTLVWVLRAQGAPHFHSSPLGRTERDRLVRSLRAAVEIADGSLAAFPKLDTQAAHQLYVAVLEKAERAWHGAESLLVVPHGSLGQIPFSLLLTQPAKLAEDPLYFAGYRALPWLVRKTAVTQLPSANTLVSLRAAKRAQRPAKAFAGFGDPVFSAKHIERPGAVSLASRSIRLRNLSIEKVAAAGVAPALRVANSSTLAQLAPLPDTADEIRDIAHALKADAADVFLGRSASETRVKGTDLSDRRIVAFATHGLVPGDLDGLTQPALALSAPEVTGNKEEDGLLAMEEVLGLKLNADWVVLSACNTASADGNGSEAVSGLGKAFFYAGARAILVSNWPVETVSARLLTTSVFRRQAIDASLARAQALRLAMLELLDEKTAADKDGKPLYAYAHPLFWAPFSLVGDGGRD